MTREVQADLSFLKIKSLAPSTAPEGSALILGATHVKENDKDKVQAVKSLKGVKELNKSFEVLTQIKSFKAKAESLLVLLEHSKGLEDLGKYSHLIALGVGMPKDCVAQNVLSWGGKIALELRRNKIVSADIFIDSLYNPAASAGGADAPKDFAGRPLRVGILSREDFLEKLALGIYLSLYTFDRYKTKDGKATDKAEKFFPKIRILSQVLDGKKASEILKTASLLAEAAYLTRDLQTTPGWDMQPAEIARQAQQAGREAGFDVTVWDEKKLKAEGMNGILTVGMGSEAPPRFIILEHNAGKKNLPTIVFVGKGVSFDTGGISIKPAQGMDEMKMDMSGAASVIGAIYALAKLDVPIHAYGLVASAENMPSGRAARPGDIYAAYDGQTVEVLNTDAEGRLVLGDALAYAHKLNPDCVIDIATLTGAVVMALGATATGIMGNNGKLLEGFKAASEKTGERVWELPLYPEYGEDMRSKIADYKNIGSEKGAGSQKGGAFLNFFVKEGYPWLHLDVAGTADTPKPQGAHCPPDVGTAVPMRSLVEFAMGFKEYFGGGAQKKKG